MMDVSLKTTPRYNTKKYILGYLLTATGFWLYIDRWHIDIYIPTKDSTHLLEKPTIVVIAYAEMKNIPFVYVDVLW